MRSRTAAAERDLLIARHEFGDPVVFGHGCLPGWLAFGVSDGCVRDEVDGMWWGVVQGEGRSRK